MRLLCLSLLVVVSSCSLLSAEQIRFDGHQVHRITPLNPQALAYLHDLQYNNEELDFWSDVKAPGAAVDVRVPPSAKRFFESFVSESSNFTRELFIDDVQKLIDEEHRQRKIGGRAFGWTRYHTLDEINGWLRDIANADRRVELLSAGRSYENREILGVKITFAPGNQNRSVFIEGNIHAREWISSATVTYLINQLISSTDPELQRIAQTRDWYIFPVVNPDGFVFSHTTNRMWRKTRTPYAAGCFGADPNRNWGYHYNQGGTSINPCSDTYRGPNAFSEVETANLAAFISTIGPNLQAYISFHSYSQLLLLPYGYSNDRLDNYNDLFTVGQTAMGALRQKFGTNYTVGNIVDLLYVASGGSMDWVKGTFRTPITYTYELRDTGANGFILPPAQIGPSGAETVDSVISIFREFDQILNK